MLVIESRCDKAAHQEQLSLPFELRQKSRLRTKLASGEEAGLFLEHGSILRGGDCLRANDGRIVLVVAADEELMEAKCATPFELVRAAYHLGNRHVPVQIGDGWLRFQADDVLAMLCHQNGWQAVSQLRLHASSARRAPRRARWRTRLSGS